ncbi:BnaA01g22510D [Brassica napus]|uniref:BnaA01g22510D protein n=1 Tax=Brassica napus TaxID=3708 RepID=A0A078GHB9_BRANA|nr:BnaA01g22510D [Brassica napus]
MKDRESDGSLDNRIFVGGLSLRVRGSFKILFTATEISSSVRSWWRKILAANVGLGLLHSVIAKELMMQLNTCTGGSWVVGSSR